MTNLRNTQFKSIQMKITLWAGLCLLLAATIIITYAAISLRSTAIAAAEENAAAVANSQAGVVKAEIEVALDAARTLAQALATVKTENLDLSRDEVNAMLKQVTVDNPQFVGTYTLWEPNAFDDRDAEFAGKEPYDDTGRFIAYWNRNEQGEVRVETPLDYEIEGPGDYYQLPKKTQQENIIDPYIYPVQGKDVLMTSLVVPIMVDGQFYGIAGVDLALDFLQQLADDVDIYDGIGEMVLISHHGSLAGVSNQPALVGKHMKEIHKDWEEDLTYIQEAKEIIQPDEGRIAVFVPIQIGRTVTPWSVNLNIPTDQITAEATVLMWQMVGIGTFLAGVALVLLWIAAGQIAKPIKQITEMAQAVADGNLMVEAQIKSKDETGVLAAAFNQMTSNLRQRIQAEQEASEKAAQLADAEREQKEYLENTIDNYLAFVERVAEGDLTTRLSLNGDSDALTILGRNLNSMVERLGEMTAQIREATAHISAAAAEILSATTQQASGANEQSAAISQTSTTIDEVKTIVEQSFSKAQAVAERAQRTSEVSQAGQRAVADTVESMEQIKEKVEGIAENILALSEQTQQIGEITATVNEIASQSNLLALNASVEAARAGEHGKGFAVVAVEVRNLAEQSRQATAQVKAILNEIQRATNAAVMATEEGTKGVDAGAQLTGQAGETIQQLASSIVESASAAQQIVASAQQQTTGMEQIALAMENINQATMQSLASTRQAEKAARDLSAVAQQMEALVTRYKLN